MRRSLICLLVSLWAMPNALAQYAPGDRGASPAISFWSSAGAGVVGTGAGPHTSSGAGFSGRAALTVQRGPLLVTVRSTDVQGGASEFRGFLRGTLHDEVQDVGVLAGYALPLGNDWSVAASAGVSSVRVRRVVPSYCTKVCLFGNGTYQEVGPLVGLPLEVTLLAPSRGWFSLGLTGFANLNHEASFGGFSLDLRAGRFR